MTNPLRDDNGAEGAQHFAMHPPSLGFAGQVAANTVFDVTKPADASFVEYNIEGAFYVTYDGSTPSLPSTFGSHSGGHFPTDLEVIPSGTTTIKIIAREAQLDVGVLFYSR